MSDHPYEIGNWWEDLEGAAEGPEAFNGGGGPTPATSPATSDPEEPAPPPPSPTEPAPEPAPRADPLVPERPRERDGVLRPAVEPPSGETMADLLARRGLDEPEPRVVAESEARAAATGSAGGAALRDQAGELEAAGPRWAWIAGAVVLIWALSR